MYHFSRSVATIRQTRHSGIPLDCAEYERCLASAKETSLSFAHLDGSLGLPDVSKESERYPPLMILSTKSNRPFSRHEPGKWTNSPISYTEQSCNSFAVINTVIQDFSTSMSPVYLSVHSLVVVLTYLYKVVLVCKSSTNTEDTLVGESYLSSILRNNH